MTKKRRGRPAKYVVDYKGKPVVGLSYNKTLGQYYNTHYKTETKGKQIYFGSDRDEAIHTFHIWLSNKQGQTTTLRVPPEDIEIEHIATKELSEEDIKFIDKFRKEAGLPPLTNNKLVFGVDGDLDAFGDDVDISSNYIIHQGLFWHKARELILNDIDKAKELLNLNIKIENAPEKTIKLSQVYKLFKNNPDYVNLSEKQRIQTYWSEFTKAVGDKQIHNITLKDLLSYRDNILSKGFGPKTVSNRFNHIKNIIKVAGKETDNEVNSKALVQLLNTCQIRLVPPKQITKQTAQQISKDDFHKLFNAASNVKYKIILLLGLNCGMKSTDICDIRLSHIDFNKKTLIKHRHKTSIIRAAVLWDITLEHINQYLSAKKFQSEYLITTDVGLNKAEPYKPHSINEFFAKLRVKAKVDISVKFEQLRDSAKTVAVSEKPELLKATDILMGHKGGIGNQYLERQPKMVKEICQIIYDFYFG